MQNLPVTAASPVIPAPVATPADNNSAAPAVTEPFGSVLARQRASADAQDSKQTAAAAANDASATAVGSDPAAEVAAPVVDAANLLPADMLAALLPSTVDAKKAVPDEKAGAQAAAPDAVSTLPGDMLAMLLPAAAVAAGATAATVVAATAASAAAAKGGAVAGGKDSLELNPDGGKKARPQPIVAAASGEARSPAGSKLAPEAAGITAMPRAQGEGKVEAGALNTSKDKAFAAALEASGKDGAKTAQLDMSATKALAQPVAPAALDGLLQSGVAPVSSNGPAQVLQAVINTPVTHEAWGDEFSQKITWMATQHDQTAELHLNPPNLGPMDVVLNVSGDQATALFTSPHAAVRDALEQALPKLRDMLADNGITLGNAMVSDQSPKDQQAWQAEQRQKGSGGARADATVAVGGISSSATVTPRRHQGMVDTFA